MSEALGSFFSAMTVGGSFGIVIGILAFIVLILIGFRTKQTSEDQGHDQLQVKELTPKELQKENNELWGCFIVIVIGGIVWFIMS